MNKIPMLLLATVFACPAALAAPADGDVTAVIHKTIDTFNSGDLKALKSMFATGSLSIVDEYAPHLWSGPDAYKNWLEAYAKDAKATGLSDPSLTFNEPTRSQIDGKTAYVIMPTVFTWKAKGAPLVEEAQMTFVLNQTSAGWKIRAMTWTGVTPHAPK